MFAKNGDHGILQRLLGAVAGRLSPEVAEFFLHLSFDESDHRRVEELSEKSGEGELTAQEKDELATYVLLTDFLSIMQARARISTENRTPAA